MFFSFNIYIRLVERIIVMAVEKIKLNQSNYDTEGQKVEYDPIKAQMSGININNGVTKDTVSFGSEEKKKSPLATILGLGVIAGASVLLYKKSKTVQNFVKKGLDTVKGLFNKAEKTADDAAKAAEGAAKAGENTADDAAKAAAEVNAPKPEALKPEGPKPEADTVASKPEATKTEIEPEAAKKAEIQKLTDVLKKVGEAKSAKATTVAPEVVAAQAEPITTKIQPNKASLPKIGIKEKAAGFLGKIKEAITPVKKEAVKATETKTTVPFIVKPKAKAPLAIATPGVEQATTPGIKLSKTVESLKAKANELASKKVSLENHLSEITNSLAKNEHQVGKVTAKITELKAGLRSIKTIEELQAKKQEFQELSKTLTKLNMEKAGLAATKDYIEVSAKQLTQAMKSTAETTSSVIEKEKQKILGKAIKELERSEAKAARAKQSAEVAAKKQQQKLDSEVDKLFAKISASIK